MQEGNQAKPLSNVRALQELEDAFRDAYGCKDDGGRTELRTKAPPQNWTTTLGLIEETAEALQAADQRIRELEARGEDLVNLAKAKLQNAKASINAAEARALKAEQRANEAEEKAKHPREWLTRIYEGLEQLTGPHIADPCRARGEPTDGPKRLGSCRKDPGEGASEWAA